MSLILNAAGGLGIFLLAMAMMTSGLKVFGGERLKHHLERWTSTPLRGVATGVLVTALVQSSSAVTVATIGFVNAGILSLGHSLGVIFGANLGTTMTGWLVSLIGFNFKIEALALPVIAAGVALRIAVQNKRLRGLGEALTGFGLFFLGLSILKDSFSTVADTFGMTTLGGVGSRAGSVALFALIGLVATILTQSSSAAIALIITAATQSVLGLGAAAAAIIGANVGTTSTAAFAVIGATPNAKRVAAGQILFNVITAALALAILPAMLWGTEALGHLLGLSDRPAIVLALFHSVFNILGIALLLPFLGPLTRFLQRRFTTAEEDISRPRHLDRTVAATPTFAVPALEQELHRMQDLVVSSAQAAIAGQHGRESAIERRATAIAQLGQATAAFAVEVRMENMTREDAEALARLLRIARYLEEAASLLPQVHETGQDAHRLSHEATRASVLDLMVAAQACLTAAAAEEGEAGRLAALLDARDGFERLYQQAKASVLQAAATHLLSIDHTDRLLDAMSNTRRMIEQVIKASLMLMEQDVAQEPAPEPEAIPETAAAQAPSPSPGDNAVPPPS